jgi:hypothetical protein
MSDPLRKIRDLHGAGIGNGLPVDEAGAGRFGQPGPIALRTDPEDNSPFHEGANMGLQRLRLLGEHRFADSGDDSLVGDVDATNLDPGRFLIEQVIALLGREGGDRLVRREETGLGEAARLPTARRVAGSGDRAVSQG